MSSDDKPGPDYVRETIEALARMLEMHTTPGVRLGHLDIREAWVAVLEALRSAPKGHAMSAHEKPLLLKLADEIDDIWRSMPEPSVRDMLHNTRQKLFDLAMGMRQAHQKGVAPSAASLSNADLAEEMWRIFRDRRENMEGDEASLFISVVGDYLSSPRSSVAPQQGPTPRCDAAEKMLVSKGPYKGDWIDYHFAVQLERELIAAQSASAPLLRVLTAAQQIRLDFAEQPPEMQAKWIHLPELRAAIDAVMVATEGGAS